jgi:uncharacterized membrane protein YfcA
LSLAIGDGAGYNIRSLRLLTKSFEQSSLPILPVTPAQLATALVLATIGSAIQGAIGIGLAVIAAPMLLMISPEFVPGPLLLAAMLLTLLVAHRDRVHTAWDEVGAGTAGRILGMLPAAYALRMMSIRSEAYDLMFAALVLAGVLISVAGWHIRLTLRNVFLTAIGSGFISTVSAVGGPPMALVYQNEAAPRMRGTLSAIFTIGTVISAAGLWWAGRFDRDELLLGVLLLPGVLVGFFLSRYTAAWLDRDRTRPAVLAVSAVSAAVIAIRALW